MKYNLITLQNVSADVVTLPGGEELEAGATIEVDTSIQSYPEVKLRLQKSALQIVGKRIFDDEEVSDEKDETSFMEPVAPPKEDDVEDAPEEDEIILDDEEEEKKPGVLERLGRATGIIKDGEESDHTTE